MLTELRILASDVDQDVEATEQALSALRTDLLDAGVDSVKPVAAGPAPRGSRSASLQVIGALAIILEPAAPLLSSVVTVVQDWISRVGQRTAILEIDGDRLELTGVDPAEQRRLADAWLAAVERSQS
ncbi:hypothetical protein [Streptomyces sp. Tu 4128]|uniref:hypothetical protein n=1 Tax=Streptomyces sp. Tu 4128 TaxID=1120314 RepID=UPI000F030015|nr:hypothetical protein [Streptomyces sp. Tu 4128]